MNTSINKIALVGILALALFGCKKEDTIIDEITSYNGPNGAIKGKVTGFTEEDSTAFSFDYKHIYEEEPDDSWWEYSNIQLEAQEEKTTATADQINVGVYRAGDTNGDTYSILYIENWDYVDGDIADADIEIYVQEYQPLNGQTLYYEHYAYNDDITVNSISFDKQTGKFSIDLKATFDEDSNDGSTDNPGTITMSYSGIILSEDVVLKKGK